MRRDQGTRGHTQQKMDPVENADVVYVTHVRFYIGNNLFLGFMRKRLRGKKEKKKSRIRKRWKKTDSKGNREEGKAKKMSGLIFSCVATSTKIFVFNETLLFIFHNFFCSLLPAAYLCIILRVSNT